MRQTKSQARLEKGQHTGSSLTLEVRRNRCPLCTATAFCTNDVMQLSPVPHSAQQMPQRTLSSRTVGLKTDRQKETMTEMQSTEKATYLNLGIDFSGQRVILRELYNSLIT